MPTLTFTKRWIESVRVAERTDFFDTYLPTFGVRVAPTGSKVWFVLYTLRGERRKRRLRLGPYPAIDLDSARADAMTAIAMVARGGDPKYAAETSGVTFGQLAALYLARHAKGLRSYSRVVQVVEHDLLPHWRSRPAASIRRREVPPLLDAIVERGAPVQANYARSVLSGIFAFGVARELVESNPVIGTTRPHEPVRRDRVLSDDEIRIFWRETAGMHSSIRDALRGILLSAQRPGEVAGLTRGELAGGEWTIPVARAKGGREHVVPVVGLFAEIIAMGGDPAVFPSDDYRRRGLPISRQALSYTMQRLCRRLGWATPARPHDLRRSAATHMGKLDIDPFAIERVLGHRYQGVTATYNRWEYLPQKRAALETWDSHVRELVSSPSLVAVGSASSTSGPSRASRRAGAGRR